MKFREKEKHRKEKVMVYSMAQLRIANLVKTKLTLNKCGSNQNFNFIWEKWGLRNGGKMR